MKEHITEKDPIERVTRKSYLSKIIKLWILDRPNYWGK